MKRLVKTLSLLSTLAVGTSGVSGCTSAIGYAAKVNGATISRTNIDEQLADIAHNKDYVARIDQPGQGGPLEGASKGSYNKAFVAGLLDAGIRFQIIHEQLAANHKLPDPTQLAGARDAIVQQISKPIFDAFPARYQKVLIDQRAEAEIFLGSPPGGDTSDAALTEYYQAHQNDYQSEVCVRHILVADKNAAGQIDYAASLARADMLSARLAAGADFAALAKSDSQDNQGTGGGSAVKGGALTGSAPDGCLSAQDLRTLIAPFAQALLALPDNKVSDPVKTQFGYHLIEVTSRTIQPLDATVKSDIRKNLAITRLNALLKAATVKVNPEFGSFNRAADTRGQVIGVVPPPVPASAATTVPPTPTAPSG